MEYNKERREIKINKSLSSIDKITLRFIKILEKHTDYVIISGYVSILLGRTRTTEDIDLFIKEMNFEKFSELYKNLKKEGFWCINAESGEEIFSYLKEKKAVRFAIENTIAPNFEVKFTKRPIDDETFSDFIIAVLPEGKLKISSFERHIAFKKYYLGTPKDIEDAVHIEELFKEKIDYAKIDKLKKIIEKIKEEEKRNESG